ncbi:MAG: ABC transporter permease [Candidatus Muiribacteriota bacterium]
MIRFDLLKNFFKLNFKLKYSSSRLGILWSFFNPLITLIIFTIVFEYILKIEMDNFPLFFFSGIVVWSFISANIVNSCFAFVRHFDIIQKIKFDYRALLLSEIGVNSIVFGVNMLLLAFFSYFSGGRISTSNFLIHFPLLILHLYLISYSLGLFVSTACVFVRDIPHATEIILNVWFYASPVFYTTEMIPENLSRFFLLNPVFYSLISIRKIFYQADFGNEYIWNAFGINSVIIIAFTILAHIFFKRNEKWFPEDI